MPISGCAYLAGNGRSGSFDGQTSGGAYAHFAASNSSSIYGASTTVQPPSSNKLLYYRVGNNVVNQSAINVGNVLGEMLNKADTNFGNVTTAGKAVSLSWGMPDYDSGITINSGFTAPENGFVVTDTGALQAITRASITIDGVNVFQWQVNQNLSVFGGMAIVAKGSTISLSNVTATFYPMKGASNA